MRAKVNLTELLKTIPQRSHSNPIMPMSITIAGEVWLHLQEWEKAKADLITAKEMGLDIDCGISERL